MEPVGERGSRNFYGDREREVSSRLRGFDDRSGGPKQDMNNGRRGYGGARERERGPTNPEPPYPYRNGYGERQRDREFDRVQGSRYGSPYDGRSSNGYHDSYRGRDPYYREEYPPYHRDHPSQSYGRNPPPYDHSNYNDRYYDRPPPPHHNSSPSRHRPRNYDRMEAGDSYMNSPSKRLNYRRENQSPNRRAMNNNRSRSPFDYNPPQRDDRIDRILRGENSSKRASPLPPKYSKTETREITIQPKSKLHILRIEIGEDEGKEITSKAQKSPQNILETPSSIEKYNLKKSAHRKQRRRLSLKDDREEVDGIIKILFDMIGDFREVEKQRISLSLRYDFVPFELFKIITTGTDLTLPQFITFVEELGAEISEPEAEIIFQNFQQSKASGGGGLSRPEFFEMVCPFSEDYRDSVLSRTSRHISSISDLSKETCAEIRRLLQKLAEISVKTRFQEVASNKKKMMELFSALDQEQNGKLTHDDISLFLDDNGFFVTTKEIKGVMKKFDIDLDGCISFDEFLENPGI